MSIYKGNHLWLENCPEFWCFWISCCYRLRCHSIITSPHFLLWHHHNYDRPCIIDAYLIHVFNNTSNFCFSVAGTRMKSRKYFPPHSTMQSFFSFSSLLNHIKIYIFWSLYFFCIFCYFQFYQAFSLVLFFNLSYLFWSVTLHLFYWYKLFGLL